jgi:hypothetical protein
MGEVLQSHEQLVVTQGFDISIGVIKMPVAGVGKGLKVTSLTGPRNSLLTKRSIVQIINQDNLCLARSLAVCQGYRRWKAGEINEHEYR